MGGDIAQFVEHWTGIPLTQIRLPAMAGDFLLESSLNADSLTSVSTPLCATTCLNLCAHMKDPVVHVRVWWIMETLKPTACTEGWVVRLSQLAFPGESNQNFPWEKSRRDDEPGKKKEPLWMTHAQICVGYIIFSHGKGQG